MPDEAIGSDRFAGAVDVLYGSGSGSQVFLAGPWWSSRDPGGLRRVRRCGVGGDYNNNGAADLAVGVPHEAIGPRFAAGAVNMLYGGGGGLTGTGSQGFWQGLGRGRHGRSRRRIRLQPHQ